ncbi:hypothetical protein QJQ45_019885 [Haematococcus lacustris]|nr:hypothetical protein QJQ45_019885 [Haematococcus lacustris]
MPELDDSDDLQLELESLHATYDECSVATSPAAVTVTVPIFPSTPPGEPRFNEALLCLTCAPGYPKAVAPCCSLSKVQGLDGTQQAQLLDALDAEVQALHGEMMLEQALALHTGTSAAAALVGQQLPGREADQPQLYTTCCPVCRTPAPWHDLVGLQPGLRQQLRPAAAGADGPPADCASAQSDNQLDGAGLAGPGHGASTAQTKYSKASAMDKGCKQAAGGIVSATDYSLTQPLAASSQGSHRANGSSSAVTTSTTAPTIAAAAAAAAVAVATPGQGQQQQQQQQQQQAEPGTASQVQGCMGRVREVLNVVAQDECSRCCSPAQGRNDSRICSTATPEGEAGESQGTAPQLHASEPDILYEVGQRANDLVAAQLAGVTPVTYAAVLAAGLATSLSPCTLSVLPLTIGYIGGYSAPASNAEPSATTQQAKPNITTQALSFSFGLATTLAGLGLLSSSVGLAYGQIGEGLPLLVSLLAIAMGLNLLQVLPLRLPSLDLDVRELTAGVPPALQAYLAGLAFALAASPCATPVLATLLAWVANTGDPVQGAALLLAYTSGYVAPLLLAATVTVRREGGVLVENGGHPVAEIGCLGLHEAAAQPAPVFSMGHPGQWQPAGGGGHLQPAHPVVLIHTLSSAPIRIASAEARKHILGCSLGLIRSALGHCQYHGSTWQQLAKWQVCWFNFFAARR